MNTKYSRPSLSFHLKPLKSDVLEQVEAHNSRLVYVPHADPSRTTPCRFMVAPTLRQSIDEIVARHGATPAAEGTNVAAEAVFSFPARMKNPPDPEAFCATIEEVAGDVFPGLIAGSWLHVDESSAHVHLVLVPICEAPTRGRRPKRKSKPPRKCVSYFRFTKTNERRPGRRRLGEPPRNQHLAELHDKFAAGVAHLGLKRGLPSARPHLPIKRIHAAHEDLLGVVACAFDDLPDIASGIISGVTQSLDEGVPTDVLVDHFTRDLQACFNVLATPLVELACRGIGFESERVARLELSHHFERIARENALLREQLLRLDVAPQLPTFEPPAELDNADEDSASIPPPVTLAQAIAAVAKAHGKPGRARPLPVPTTPTRSEMQP